MRRPSFLGVCRGACLSAGLASLFLLQCVSEREILGESGLESASGGEAADCYEALARGTNGGPCTGTFSCSTAPRPCCTWSAVCANGFLTISEDCASCACRTDADCSGEFWCVAGECRACPAVVDCVFPNIVVPRNGCSWCVPLGECASDAECPAGTICYAGRACTPGCSSPSCCFGSLCDAPGCGSTEELDCSLVGCADSGTCEVVGRWPDCACESGRWSCSSDAQNICIAL